MKRHKVKSQTIAMDLSSKLNPSNPTNFFKQSPNKTSYK